jgi:uncharacterized protein YlaI
MVVMKVMAGLPSWSSKRLDNIHIHLFMSERFGLQAELRRGGITWSSKRFDNIHIHLFMSERFGLQAAHGGVASLGVQSAWITYTSISLCLSALDFKQRIGASGITWSSKRLDNIHIHLFMPERFGLQAAHRSEWHHLEFKALG